MLTSDSLQSDAASYTLLRVYHQPRSLILASSSPRRVELLTRAGYIFDVMPADVDEQRKANESPTEYVTRLAITKVSAIAAQNFDRVVIGADTTVVVDSEVLGKPKGPEEAACMLQQLAGRAHKVMTGVAVRLGEVCISAVEMTVVHLVELDDALIAWYVGTGEPLDKAGAYGIQGIASRFVDRIEGSYSNVVGLPLVLVDQLLVRLSQAPASR